KIRAGYCFEPNKAKYELRVTTCFFVKWSMGLLVVTQV
ncbi:MAG: hypothetical protein ACI9UT_002489, partial [Flavobacteriales bacterium]